MEISKENVIRLMKLIDALRKQMLGVVENQKLVVSNQEKTIERIEALEKVQSRVTETQLGIIEILENQTK